MTVILDSSRLERLSAGYDPIPERSSSLPAECYVDPVYLDVEREQLFRRSWQLACHLETVRTPGSYFVADIQGYSIAITRDLQGTLRAFYNVCKHRAHELLSGAGKTRLITCPYHGWCYELSGELRRARCTEHLQEFTPSDIHLDEVQVEEFCGFVYVNLDHAAPSLAEQTGDLGREIQQYAPDIETLTHAHRITYDVRSNWKTLVDNFLECYHCPIAHRDFCTLVEMDTYEVTTHRIYSSHMAKAGRRDNTAYDVAGAAVTDHAVWWLWPNTCLLRYPGDPNFLVLSITPVAPDRTIETYDFYFSKPEPSAQEWEAIKYVDEVLQVEDINLCESVQRGMSTPAFKSGRFVCDPNGGGLSEHGVHHFHGLMLEAYGRSVV